MHARAAFTFVFYLRRFNLPNLSHITGSAWQCTSVILSCLCDIALIVACIWQWYMFSTGRIFNVLRTNIIVIMTWYGNMTATFMTMSLASANSQCLHSPMVVVFALSLSSFFIFIYLIIFIWWWTRRFYWKENMKWQKRDL